MKKLNLILIASMSIFSFSVLAGGFTMSEADKAMYAEMKENNPAEIVISYGEELFEEDIGEDNYAKFLGVKTDDLAKELASYPKYFEKVGEVVTYEHLIQAYMASVGKKPYKFTSKEMTAIASYTKSLANDLPHHIDINANKHIKKAYAFGKKMFNDKRGIRGFACVDCHGGPGKGVAGGILRTQRLTNVATANSYGNWPAYRTKKSKLRTMHVRFKGCMSSSLQAKIKVGSKEMVALEVYVESISDGGIISIPGLKG